MNATGAAPVDKWTAGASGSWKVASNWSLGRAPQAGDTVDIESNFPIIVTYDVGALSLGGLTLVGATLTLGGGNGALTPAGPTNLQNATIDGSGPMTLAGANNVEGLTVGGAVKLVNRGKVTQSGGSITIGDSPSSTAEIINAQGFVWSVSDASGMTQASTTGWGFYNQGLYKKTSGSGFDIIRANFVSTGTIASAAGGDIVLDGKISSISGTYIGAGMVDYGPDGVTRILTVNVTQACCQTNVGTVNLVGSMTMSDGSTLVNASGAHWNFDGDSSLWLAAGQAAGPDINGAGTLAKTAGTGTSHVSVVATLSGLVSIATGTLSFEGATSSFSSAIDGAGTFQIGGGAATIASGAQLAVARWTLAGGITTLGENVDYTGAFSGKTAATLALGGEALTLSGATNLSGLTLSGTGALDLTSTAVYVTALTMGGATQTVVTGRVTQTGVVSLGDASAADAAELTVAAGGGWVMNGGAIELGADPASSINISGSASHPGLFAMLGSGTATVAPNVYNNALNVGSTLGGVKVLSGVLDFQGEVLGAGSANILGSATLEFDNDVASGQTVNFLGANETLRLDDLADFHGAVSGFDHLTHTDALLIGGGWSFAGATETATSASLSFTQGSQHETLTLQGDYSGGAFSAATLGGQLKITY